MIFGRGPRTSLLCPEVARGRRSSTDSTRSTRTSTSRAPSADTWTKARAGGRAPTADASTTATSVRAAGTSASVPSPSTTDPCSLEDAIRPSQRATAVPGRDGLRRADGTRPVGPDKHWSLSEQYPGKVDGSGRSRPLRHPLLSFARRSLHGLQHRLGARRRARRAHAPALGADERARHRPPPPTIVPTTGRPPSPSPVTRSRPKISRPSSTSSAPRTSSGRSPSTTSRSCTTAARARRSPSAFSNRQQESQARRRW